MKTKSMKPLSLLLAVLLLCSLFAGCSEADSSVSPGPSETAGAASPQDSDDGPSAPSDSEPTKIAFISYMAIDSAEFLQNLAAALEQFADDHSDSVEVKIIEATQASEYEPKIRTACDAGYEIVITTYDSMAEATWRRLQGLPGRNVRHTRRRELPTLKITAISSNSSSPGRKPRFLPVSSQVPSRKPAGSALWQAPTPVPSMRS